MNTPPSVVFISSYMPRFGRDVFTKFIGVKPTIRVYDAIAVIFNVLAHLSLNSSKTHETSSLRKRKLLCTYRRWWKPLLNL